MAGKQDISVFEFIRRFGTKEACAEYMTSVRWPNGVACAYCSHTKAYIIEKGKRFKCANSKCHKKFSRTVGTLMEDTNIPLPAWFLLIYTMASNRKSISSYQISRNLGLSQKSAWSMMHKLRLVFEEKHIEKLSGIVEVDECFIGKGNRWQRWGGVSTRKTPIIGLIERGGRVIIKTIDDRTKRTVEKIIHEHVAFGSTIYTDGWLSYRKLRENYIHEWIDHGNHEYVRGDVHTNNIEGIWAYFKRNIRSGHHWISGKHVQRYCNEVSWKFNNRHLTMMQRFDEILKLVLESRQLIVEFKKVKQLRAA